MIIFIRRWEQKNFQKRRESAPVFTTCDLNATRDEAYLKDFNEWRKTTQKPLSTTVSSTLKTATGINYEDEIEENFNDIEEEEEEEYDDGEREFDDLTSNDELNQSFTENNYDCKNKSTSGIGGSATGNGSYRNFNINVSSICQPSVSPATKTTTTTTVATHTNHLHEKRNSIYLNDATTVNKERRYSPPYQTVTNIHGDEVEYALPFNEEQQLRLMTTVKAEITPNYQQCEDMINSKFRFLESKIDSTDMSSRHFVDPISTLMERRSRNVIITDLDKSETSSRFERING